ncbi:DNA translocase FtsK [Virgibacillus indicus]|uniref:DNA translocase FtsK n=1 Tax=Virgibacillus indicus TaxID=2024554 RepID=UPI001F0B0220|nr:DNA translocase FtsK [Virgibacillus indicus]
MLEQWKNKLLALFYKEVEIDEEVELEIDESRKIKQNQNVHAKMTYKYPENKSFRFPVIPDVKEEDAKVRPSAQRKRTHTAMNEKPAYQRKSESGKNRRTEPQQPNRISSKVYKKESSIPFQPTEVPSPIYGFQPRKKDKEIKEIEEVPAFQRKREKEEKQETQNELSANGQPNQLESTKRDVMEQESPVRPIQQKNTVQQAERQPEEQQSSKPYSKIKPIQQEDSNQKTELQPIQQQDPNHQSMDEQPVKEPNKEPALLNQVHNEAASTKEEVRPAEQKQIKQQHERRKTENSTNKTAFQKRRNDHENRNQKSVQYGPYNVMMTPRDKKNLLERNKQKEIKPVPSPEQQSIPYHLLNDPVEKSNDDRLWVKQQQGLLEETLKHFNVRAKVVNATQGPSVTRFEVQPELGVKVSKVKNLSDDLKLNMSAKDIRIEAPIPGKNTIGIEIPNKNAQMVGLQGIFEAEAFKQSKSPLSIALGLSIEGLPVITNIQKMPHGLIAGATGSGKSVCINTILISLLYKASHEDVKFMLIDPKMVELAPYNGIPHLVSPVITDVKAATAALKWAVNEMEDRYEKFVHEGVRDIERYNQKVLKQGRLEEKMPFIVIVIDELADLMMVSPQDVEDAISRIAQKARACGIHLLLATQRPSVDVITGLIKANIPTRIAFSVSSQVDSRTIIDTSGAEKLLGKGDMLFVENGAGKSVRLQGPFVSDEEIERVTNYARNIAEPDYLFEQEQLLEQVHEDEEADVLLDEAIQFVLQQNSASTSLMQRHFKIGYNRAARLIDTLEHRGIISGQNGSKPREVLINQAQADGRP